MVIIIMLMKDSVIYYIVECIDLVNVWKFLYIMYKGWIMVYIM